MADEITTQTTQTTQTTPAGGAVQTTDPAPTAEQKNAFQKFMESLFNGKAKEEPAPADKGAADPAAAATETKAADTATLTEADLQAKLNEAKKAWDAERQEQERLAKLSPEERTKAEEAAKDKKLTELEARLLQRDLKDSALQKLQKDGFPVGLADLLAYTDQASMEKSLQHTQEVFKSCLEAAIKERLKGKTPEGLGGAANAENAIKDQIAKNIRGGIM
ncbi:MAG: DUF4355 domain-containing protein [Oscillibacter sp.]|nr:DUF4355 domain-containing protein [Oscillibacter sp.]